MREGAMDFLKSTQMEKQATNKNEMLRQQTQMEQIDFGNDK